MPNKNMPAKRKQLSKKLRFEVFKRDRFVCQYCGSVPPNVLLQVDHIVPVALFNKNKVFKYFCGVMWRKIKEAEL